jgi:hypothetical protein
MKPARLARAGFFFALGQFATCNGLEVLVNTVLVMGSGVAGKIIR